MCVYKFLLHQLEGRKRSFKLLPLKRIFARTRHAILECAYNAPRDAIPCAVEASEGRAQAEGFGQESRVWCVHAVKENRTSDRDAEGQFVFNLRSGKSFRSFLKKEASNFTIPLAPCPYDEEVTVRVWG